MYDHHTHHVGDVQGAADDRHAHTPREIGAADDHDLDMLKRDVNSAESDIRALERKVQALEGKVGTLEGQVEYWTGAHSQLQEQFVQLGELVEPIAAYVAAQQRRF